MPASSCDEPLVLDGDGKWRRALGMSQIELASEANLLEKPLLRKGRPAKAGLDGGGVT